MFIQRGYIDASGHPRFKITVHGPTGKGEFDALIDTGFTGFLLLPELAASRLGMVSVTTMPFTMANGAEEPFRVLIGNVEIFPNETLSGIVALGGFACPLIGMGLLRKAKKALFVDSTTVALVNEEELKRFVGSSGAES